MPVRHQSGSRDRLRRKLEEQAPSLSRMLGRERQGRNARLSVSENLPAAVATTSNESTQNRDLSSGQAHEPPQGVIFLLRKAAGEPTTAASTSSLVDTLSRRSDVTSTGAETPPLYWQQALLKLEQEKPELKDALSQLKNAGDKSSAELADTMQERIKGNARTLEERTLSLPFNIRVKTSKIRRHMNIVLRSVLAFKDCSNLAARLDPYGAAPFVWGGISTFLQVCPPECMGSSHVQRLTNSER